MLKSQLKKILKTCNFKASKEDIEMIKKKADQYADGNVSEWIRHAAIFHKPRKSQLAKVEPHATKK